MQRQVAIFLSALVWHACLCGYYLELNTSYSYFRGSPDGSWNGNQGIVFAAHGEATLTECFNVQLGGSYGAYNWDGRGNLVFGNSKRVEEIAFLTTGFTSSFSPFRLGLVYDHLFTAHFGIYNRDPSIDQLRFKASYALASEEWGIWGTNYLSTAHEHALGIPVRFRSISQINFFWSHCFENGSKSTLWVGAPYRRGLHHKYPGRAIAGFALRAPLTCRLLVDGSGAYMWARKSQGARQSRNYIAALTLGLTYTFGNLDPCQSPYLPLATPSTFFIDTNMND